MTGQRVSTALLACGEPYRWHLAEYADDIDRAPLRRPGDEVRDYTNTVIVVPLC